MAATSEKKNGTSILRVILGLGMLLPAVIACLATLLVPTLKTLLYSFEKISFGPPQFIGLENFTELFEDRIFMKSLGLTFSLMLVRVAVVAVVPLLLAVAVNELGRGWRMLTRFLVTIPLALFAPAAAALAWFTAINNPSSLLNRALTGLGMDPLGGWTPQSASSALIFLESLAAAALACGIGLPVFLAALRGSGDQPPSGKQIVRPLLLSWIIGLIAAMILPFPSFETSWIVFKGGPVNSTTTLGTYLYNQGFLRFHLGIGAAVAVLILCVAALAGLIVGLILVFGKLRLETVAPGKPSAVFSGEGKPKGRRTLFAVLAVWMLLNVLCLLALGLPPVLGSLSSATDGLTRFLERGFSFGTILNTVLPPLIAVLLLQLPIAYLGALGIGAARPLGKWSEALLLPFAPWLLVTVFPLTVALYQSMREMHTTDQWINLIPPIALSVPMLVVLTLFFKGQEPKWRAAQSAGKSGGAAFLQMMILPSLPLAALLAAAALLVSMQEFVWPMVSVNNDTLWPISVFLMNFNAQYGMNPGLPAAAIVILELPIFIVFYAIFSLFNIFYMDRLAITAGDSNK